MTMTALLPKSALARTSFHLALTVLLLLGAGSSGLLAGETEKPAASAEKPAEKAEQVKTVPAPGEGFTMGEYTGRMELEVGYRWVSDIAGNGSMYRSMVNLGEGPKLIRSRVSLRAPYGKGQYPFDRIDFSMDSWGGDPYNTLRINMSRADQYEFRVTYRNLNYYNFIPTYANPLLGAGQTLGQHSLGVTYRTVDLDLKLIPHRKVRPFIGFSRTTGFGPGFSTYSIPANEFLLDTFWQYSADEYRGGLEFDLPRLNLSVEQGYRFLRNDTGLSLAGSRLGNNPTTFIGQPIVLDSVDRGYHEQSRVPVSRVLAKFTPFRQLRLTGRYIYSMTRADTELNEVDKGNIVSLENRLIYAASLDEFSGRLRSPNHRGSYLADFTPFSRLRFLNNLDHRHYHITGASLLSSTFVNVRSLAGPFGATGQQKLSKVAGSLFALDQFRNQAELELDLGYGFVARGGHRYTFIDTTLEDVTEQFTDLRREKLVQHTGIVGVHYRKNRRLHLAFDYENNRPDRAFVRTDLLDYDRFNFSWRFSPWKNLSANGRVSLLRNSNPAEDIGLTAHNRNYSFGVNYDLGERFTVGVDYSRSNIFSDISILIPLTFELDRSLFDERSHAVGGSLGVGIYRGSRLDFGYRGIYNVGSLPLNYHQPYASVHVPLHFGLAFRTYWQYFGYNEKSASLQDYRGHLATFSLAYSY